MRNIEWSRRCIPGMTDAYDMVHIAQSELQEFVRENSPSISEAKQTVISKDSPQPHGSSMQDSFMAQTAETSMAVDNFDSFAYDNVAEHWEEGEDSGEGRFSVDDEERHVVDFEAVGEVPYTCSAGVCVSDDYDFVPTINEFLDEVSSRPRGA